MLITPKTSALRGKKVILRSLWKIRFLLISSKISSFKKKDLFEKIIFENIIFCPYSQKYQNSRKSNIFHKSFLSMCPKISAFRGKLLYFEIPLKKCILFIYTKISMFREKGGYLEITLKKSLFAHISEKIKIQRKATFL